MSKNNSEEINFQQYVDAVKHKRMDWNIFIALMQDLSYSDKGRLRHFNAVILDIAIFFTLIEFNSLQPRFGCSLVP